MILVVGGRGAGKTAWVRATLGFTPSQLSSDPASPCPVLTGLEQLVARELEAGREPSLLLPLLLEKQAVVCDEVGCGVVPLDAVQRRWREEVGRLCAALAGEAGTVVRLVCGLPQLLKGKLHE